jgi:lipopolysaccharide export LptBFGC system permease protein LptF
MMIHQLLNPAAHGVSDDSRIIRMKTRGLELIASLASPLVFMLISFCAITAGGLNRHGYGRRIFVAIIAALMFQISIIAVASLAARGGFDSLLIIWPLSVLGGLSILLTLQNDRAFMHRLMRRGRA